MNQNDFIDTPLDLQGKYSAFTPKTNTLKTKYQKEILELYNSGLLSDISQSANIAQQLWNGVPFSSIKQDYAEIKNKFSFNTEAITGKSEIIRVDNNISTHTAVDKSSVSGVNNNTSSISNHKNTHKKLEENSIKNFFGANRLVGFDTETTGLDTTSNDFRKRSKIWQTGLAIDGASGVEQHTSPFFMGNADGSLSPAPKVQSMFVEDAMRKSNGKFSEKAFLGGNFNQFFKDYESNSLVSLDKSISNTLGNIQSSDVVVLQNMNFENRILKSSLDQGLLSPDLYQNIASRMQTVSLDGDGNINTLFERPANVQEYMRKADMIYHSEYLNSFSEEAFQAYRSELNSAYSSYKDIISDTKRKGAVAVELQDISKMFLANAADKGLIDKQTSTLGLNVDFLSRAILSKTEQHTALQDSQDSIDIFKRLIHMNDEIVSGKDLSTETLNVFERIKEQQPDEINSRFLKSVRSVVDDFTTRNYTNLKGKYAWYNPEIVLREQSPEGFSTRTLDRISFGNTSPTSSLKEALENNLGRFDTYSEGINGFDRKKYTNDLLESFNNGNSYSKIKEKVDQDIFNFKPTSIGDTSTNIIAENLTNNINSNSLPAEDATKLFGIDMSKKSKYTILGGLGLAAMAFTSRPHPAPNNDGHVSEQFYDEQYLGSAFVDFKERNKHYMM